MRVSQRQIGTIGVYLFSGVNSAENRRQAVSMKQWESDEAVHVEISGVIPKCCSMSLSDRFPKTSGATGVDDLIDIVRFYGCLKVCVKGCGGGRVGPGKWIIIEGIGIICAVISGRELAFILEIVASNFD